MDQFRQLQPIRRLTALAGSEAAARLLALVLLLALVRLLTLGSVSYTHLTLPTKRIV